MVLTGLHVTFPLLIEALQNEIKTDLPGCKFRDLIKCWQVAKKNQLLQVLSHLPFPGIRESHLLFNLHHSGQLQILMRTL